MSFTLVKPEIKQAETGNTFDKEFLAKRDPDKELWFYDKLHVNVTENHNKQLYHLLTFGYTRQIIDDDLNLYIDYYDIAGIILRYIIPIECINAPLCSFCLSDNVIECRDEKRGNLFCVSRHNVVFINEPINYKPRQSIIIQKNNCGYTGGDYNSRSIVTLMDDFQCQCLNRYIYNAKLFVVGIKNFGLKDDSGKMIADQSVLENIKKSIQNVDSTDPDNGYVYCNYNL